MGKGTSKASRDSSLNSIIIVGDESIDLSNIPLQYGDKDKAVSDEARAKIKDFEENKYKENIEYNLLTDSEGNKIEDNIGDYESVGASISARKRADIYTHNHPRERGVLGGTFSPDDIRNFSLFNQTTYRATTKEGVYSISKTSGYMGFNLLKSFRKIEKDADGKRSDKCSKLTNAYKKGKLSYSRYVKLHNKANNEYFVALHNWLMSNQSQYGYTYTLERR